MSSILSFAQGAIGERQSSAAEYGQERSNALIYAQNAESARQDAKRVRQETSLAEEALRRTIRQDLGAAFAAAAQSGARGGGGTTADAQLGQSAKLAELDALNIRYGGELEAQALETDARNLDYEAKGASERAKYAKKRVQYGTIGQLLGGAAAYGTTAQNNRARDAERKARTPGYTYGGINYNVRGGSRRGRYTPVITIGDTASAPSGGGSGSRSGSRR